jgi:hypothetical protein
MYPTLMKVNNRYVSMSVKLVSRFALGNAPPPNGGQRADVPVQVQPVQALYFQRDVSIQQFRDARHARDSIQFANFTLVGLRSKTSLAAS